MDGKHSQAGWGQGMQSSEVDGQKFRVGYRWYYMVRKQARSLPNETGTVYIFTEYWDQINLIAQTHDNEVTQLQDNLSVYQGKPL